MSRQLFYSVTNMSESKTGLDAMLENLSKQLAAQTKAFNQLKSHAVVSDEETQELLKPDDAEEIDDSIRINIHEDFDIDNIATTCYSPRGSKQTEANWKYWKHAIEDCKRVLALTRSGSKLHVIYKEISNNDKQKYEIKVYELKELTVLQSVKLFYLSNSKGCVYNLYQFIQLPFVMQHLMFKGYKFYSPNPKYYSIFRGYPHQPAPRVNKAIIQPFIDHIMHIVCSDNVALNDWLWKWFAWIIQNPDGMTTKVPLLIGEPGCGKTSFCTNQFATLIGSDYAIKNCTNANELFGKFNGLIENKKLIVLNELADGEASSFSTNTLDYARFKSMVSDTPIDITNKYQPCRIVDNVLNLIIVSNNSKPFGIDQNDRRLVPIYCKNTYAENIADDEHTKQTKRDYFNKLAACVENEEFYPQLLRYVLSMKLDTWSPNELPKLESKKMYVEASLKPHEQLFQEHITQFVSGWDIELLYSTYTEFCKSRGHKGIMSQVNLINELAHENSKYCLRKLRRTTTNSNGKRPYYLAFTDEGLKQYASLIKEADTDIKIALRNAAANDYDNTPPIIVDNGADEE